MAAHAGWLRRVARQRRLVELQVARRSTVVAAVVALVCIIVRGCFAPLARAAQPVRPGDAQPAATRFKPPAWIDGRRLRPIPLGTDDQGRDVLSAIMYGARMSLLVGVCVGGLSRWCSASRSGCSPAIVGGTVDAFIMRVADVQLSFPAILIALLIDGVGARASAARACTTRSRSSSSIVAIGLCRLGAVRAHRARLDAGRAQQGIRAGGARHRRVAAAHHAAAMCCPTCMGPVLVIATHQPRPRDHHRGDAVVPRRRRAADPALARHADPHRQRLPVLGRLVDHRLPRRRRWSLLVLSVNLLGDWLRDALNPKLR